MHYAQGRYTGARLREACAACPLPGLMGDGKLRAVDFRAMAMVDRFYLTVDKQVACLSEFGWAYQRQRLTIFFTQVAIHLQNPQRAWEPTWAEIELWEQWNALGRPPDDYQRWLDAYSPEVGFTRRQPLERRMGRLVASALPAHAS